MIKTYPSIWLVQEAGIAQGKLREMDSGDRCRSNVVIPSKRTVECVLGEQGSRNVRPRKLTRL